MALYIDIEKRLPGFTLCLQLEAREGVTALFGASGCGKTMTLKCIAGLERPDRGRIELNGVTLFDSARGIDLPARQRRVGLLFQNYALFPNMTARQNIAAGICARRKKPDPELTDRMLRRFGLEAVADRYPRQLSGGEQQRTALARLVVSEPEVLLLDEPFSALDSHLRLQTEQYLRKLLSEFQKPAIFVSHDRQEVYRLSRSVAVMDAGTVVQQGSREAVFRTPRVCAAARLVGCRNISAVAEGRAAAWDLPLPRSVSAAPYVGIWENGITLTKDGFGCTVEDIWEQTDSCLLHLRPEGAKAPLLAAISGAVPPVTVGDRVGIAFDPQTILPLGASSGEKYEEDQC